MVRKRGKRRTASSRKTLEASDAAENALAESLTSGSLPLIAEEGSADTQFVDKVETAIDEVKDEECEEIYGDAESVKETEVSDVKNKIVTEIIGDNREESERSASDDDELDDQEDVMWEDEENYEDDDAFDEDEVIEEESTEEENGDKDEDGGEEPIEEEDDDDDEVSEEHEPKGEGNDENTQEEKEIAKGDGREAKAKKDSREVKEHNTEKAKVSLRNIKKSSQRSSNNKVQAEMSEKVDAKDKPESSRKRKLKKRVKSMGMIFMCSSKTKNDCYKYRVLGLPETKKGTVEKIYTGMRLFLYDVDLKLMYGIYKAVGPGGYNIEPKAFKSQFPSQVRFTVLDDCWPLPEEKFKKVMKENYYTKTKFDCQLNSEQVKKLCNMFIASSKGASSRKLGRTPRAEKHHPAPRGRVSRQRAGDGTRIALREEIHYHEPPRKRLRKALVSPVRPSRRPPVHLPSAVPSYVYEDSYLEHHSPTRGRHDPPLNLRDRDPYRDGRDSYLEHHYSYREGRDPYTERSDSYRDGRDPYIDTRDPYRDSRDLRHDSYRPARDPYLDRHDLYRDERDPPYIQSRDSYRDERDPYLERHVIYRNVTPSEPYSTYRRGRLPVHSDDVYVQPPVVENRDRYRRDEVYPLSWETRHRRDIDERDPYVSKRERPSLAERIYGAEYPSRPGLSREYRL